MERFREPRDEHHDESVREFISRRFSPKVADNLISPVVHGIYAGDIDSLSARTLCGNFWLQEAKGRSMVQSLTDKWWQRDFYYDDVIGFDSLIDSPSQTLKSMETELSGYSTLTFLNGLTELIKALESSIRKSGKAKIITNARVTSVTQQSDSSDLTISFEHHGSSQARTHSHVIATIAAPELANILKNRPQGQESDHLTPTPVDSINGLKKYNYAVTVMPVSLYYPNPNVVPVKGFGYLIPRSIPFNQNPELALGVIFESQATAREQQKKGLGEIVTVMLGGHYWDGWKESDFPDHETAVAMARSVLERHLGIKDEPTITRSRLQRNAMPQYTVGHVERMMALYDAVCKEFRCRLTLAGTWYGVAGVPSCVQQGYIAAASRIAPSSDGLSADSEGGTAAMPSLVLRNRYKDTPPDKLKKN